MNYFIKGIASIGEGIRTIFSFGYIAKEKHLTRKYLNNLDVYSDFQEDWQAIESDFSSVLKKKP